MMCLWKGSAAPSCALLGLGLARLQEGQRREGQKMKGSLEWNPLLRCKAEWLCHSIRLDFQSREWSVGLSNAALVSAACGRQRKRSEEFSSWHSSWALPACIWVALCLLVTCFSSGCGTWHSAKLPFWVLLPWCKAQQQTHFLRKPGAQDQHKAFYAKDFEACSH